MSQNSLWQINQQNNDFAEICNALYERELRMLANNEFSSVQNIQGRLKSLTYYINRIANLMTQVKLQEISPLTLDIQNASWSAKQATKLSLTGQTKHDISSWYLTTKLPLGLVVPILKNGHVILDSIDKIDTSNKKIRTNASGWFSLACNEDALVAKSVVNNSVTAIVKNNEIIDKGFKLLKPNKKIMLAACAGHCWQVMDYSQEGVSVNSAKLRPSILSLRELLLSCSVNWKDFKQPLAL